MQNILDAGIEEIETIRGKLKTHGQNEPSNLRFYYLKQFIVRLRVSAEALSSRAPVAQVRVRYDSLVGDMDPFERSESVDITSGELSSPDPEVQREVWMAAEHEGQERTAEEISQLLYHIQVMMLACDLDLKDVYKYL